MEIHIQCNNVFLSSLGEDEPLSLSLESPAAAKSVTSALGEIELLDQFDRPIRSGAAIAGVRDLSSGLIWAPTYARGRVLTFAEGLEAAAEAGAPWRMPTDLEIQTIIDRTKCNPAVRHPKMFADLKPEGHWTSTVDASDPESDAWVAYLSNGSIYRSRQSGKFWVRLVRGPVSPGQ